jgi:hypothetical protein
MAADAAELSSLTTTLAELERRIAAIAGRWEGTNHDDAVAALYDAERTLRAATRAVERASRLLR